MVLGVDFRQVCSPAKLLKTIAKSIFLSDACCNKQKPDRGDEEPESASSSADAVNGTADEVDYKTERRASVPNVSESTRPGTHSRSASWPSATFKRKWDEWAHLQNIESDDEGPDLHSLDTQSAPFEWGSVGQQSGSVFSFLRDSRTEDNVFSDEPTTMSRARSCPSDISRLSRPIVITDMSTNQKDQGGEGLSPS